MARPRRTPIHLLFFASGASGLIYQVIWVRQFGNLFGNTLYSAALVTGVFMLGLGLGSWLIGRWIDRVDADGPRSIRLYGQFEVAIGLLGLLIAALLPFFEPLAAQFAGYQAGPNGWMEPAPGGLLVSCGIAVVLLLPITALMGGTLPLLVRYRLRDGLDGVGLRVGLLYGINTAGAAIGALSVDLTLVPTLGLFASQSIAALINLVVGLVALRAAPVDAGTSPTTPDPGHPASGERTRVSAVALAIALSGFGAMGIEMLWFRLLRTALGGYRATFSLLLAVMLLGMWIGSSLGGWLERRFGRPALLYGLAQAGFVLLTVLSIGHLDALNVWDQTLFDTYRAGGPLTRRLVDLWSLLRIALWVVAAPAVLMGFAYPLANAIVQRTRAHIGGRAGVLYFANTLGAVAGTTLTGFLLIPALGMQTSLLVLGAISTLAIVPLLLQTLSERTPRRTAAWVTAIVVAVAPLAWWGNQVDYRLAQLTTRPGDETDRLLVYREGLNETIVVTESADRRHRSLYTDNHPMSATLYDGLRYMRAFSHVPLLAMDAPERVLVICFGVGNTAHAASLHPSVTELHVADLSRDVLEVAPLFARWNRSVLTDPRVTVFVNDGRQHLRTQPEGFYDLVTLEPPPIRHAGIASLYSVEFYALARRHLREGGYLTQWLPAAQAQESVNRSIVRAFLDVFPNAIMLAGFDDEFILVGVKGGEPRLDPTAWTRRLTERPAVAADLRRIDLLPLSEFVAMFVADTPTLEKATAGVPPITDDLPLMEYGPARFGQFVIPPDWFELDAWPSWCPACAEDPALRAEVDARMQVLKAYYAAPSVLTQGSTVTAQVGVRLPETAAARAALSESGFLRRLLQLEP